MSRAAATTTTERERISEETRRHRFPREARLLDEASYSRVFSNARRSRDGLFTVLCRRRGAEGNGQIAPNSVGNRARESCARLGLAISKKNCRLAVGRTRIKRIVRESFRQHQHALAGLDVVVLNKPKTHQANNQALFQSLEIHWRRCQPNKQDQAGQKPDG